jgi:ribulose 1,5-bisphosphate carboxylase large subunit-like protein
MELRDWIIFIGTVLSLLLVIIGVIVRYSNEIQKLKLEDEYRMKENIELRATVAKLESDFHNHENDQRNSIIEISHSISNIEKNMVQLISFLHGSGLLRPDFKLTE